jgi:hypothetical protein
MLAIVSDFQLLEMKRVHFQPFSSLIYAPHVVSHVLEKQGP